MFAKGEKMQLDNFEYRLLKFIRNEKIISSGDRVVLAVSGGADSVAMMYSLANLRSELKATFFVAHLNHMIRPEAYIEEPAVCSMAKELGMECFTQKRNVPDYQKKHRSLSLEEAARIVRYEFFDEAMERFKANKIATAHHLSDLTENFFIRLFRGSGVGGLIGMRSVNGKYIKPFLFLDEESIREYVTIRRLRFFEDKTNEDTKYVRNKIRHELIPFIKSGFCPDVEEKVRRVTRILEGYQDFMLIEVKKLLEKAYVDDKERIFFKLKDLDVQRVLLEETIKEVFRTREISISSVKIKSLVDLIKKNGSGELNLGNDFFAFKYDDTLMIGKKPVIEEWKETELRLGFKTTLSELSLTITAEVRTYNGYVGDGIKEAVVDADKVNFPLFLRKLKKDESVRMLGMSYFKDGYSILKDKKVPIFLRKCYPVVSQNDGKMIWLIGVGISEDFKVTPKTKKVLFLSQEGGNFFKHA